MVTNSPQPGRAWVPFFVLLLALVVTAGATAYVARMTEAKDRLRFESAVQHTRDSIQNRIETYIGLLRGGAGFIVASRSVNRAAFRAYVAWLQLPQRYAGVQGIGISARVLPEEKAAVVAKMRTDSTPTFRIWPDYPRPEYHTIVYLEPLDRRNRRALGYDMYTEPVRRAAMAKSRDTGLPAASGRVHLIQEIDAQKQAGFLIYVPIYERGEMPKTVAGRRRALEGFVYSPFRGDDLLQDIFGMERHRGVRLRIYDGTEPAAEHLMHDSDASADGDGGVYRPRFNSTTTIDVAGRPWTIACASRPDFELTSGTGVVPMTLFGGLLISGLLFGITSFQVRAREAAERSAAELRRSEGRARRLVESNVIGVLLGDFQGNVLEANDAFLNMVGCTREDLHAGRLRASDLTPPEHRHLDERAVAEMRRRGTHTPFQKEYLREDGTRVPVLVGTAVLEDEQDLAVSFIVDLTEQKRAEKTQARLYREAEEARAVAEEASRLKDDFLATVSHELRTPLNAILGYSQVLRRGNRTPEELARGLEAIERNVKAQAQLINDLLDVSRIISGKLRLDVQPVDLASVIDAAIEAVAPAADAREIRVARALDPSVGPISGDPNRLQQVVWNLLSNAIKFTPPGGEVGVQLERVDGHAEITLRDSGVGIAPEFLPHVFDRFRQSDSSTTRRHGGLGLGLAIVRHLVELHGGTVRAESDGEGQGARFIVTLPLPAPRASGEMPWDSPAVAGRAGGMIPPGTALDRPPRLAGLRVLVVDDEPDAREVIQKILEDDAAEVAAVPSARAAVEALASFRPHVLVSDIGMPDEDGYDLIRRVRTLEPERGGSTPAAALTAFARAEDRHRALLAGFQTHLVKPVEPDELVDTVAGLAGRGAG